MTQLPHEDWRHIYHWAVSHRVASLIDNALLMVYRTITRKKRLSQIENHRHLSCYGVDQRIRLIAACCVSVISEKFTDTRKMTSLENDLINNQHLDLHDFNKMFLLDHSIVIRCTLQKQQL